MMISVNPLMVGISLVERSVAVFKEHARQFFCSVMLYGCACPACNGRLAASRIGFARCRECGCEVDLTVAFQKSQCCQAHLVLRKAHYACKACGRHVLSKFLFDERVFDVEYFRERMRACRQRERERRDKVRQLLMGSRSQHLSVAGLPGLDEIPGLVEALDAFVGSAESMSVSEFLEDDGFDIGAYRQAILTILEESAARFSSLPCLSADVRVDRARRFVTLIFMEHEREVHLTQYGNDLMVSKNEADVEG